VRKFGKILGKNGICILVKYIYVEKTWMTSKKQIKKTFILLKWI
jgi:hypothetical protein